MVLVAVVWGGGVGRQRSLGIHARLVPRGAVKVGEKSDCLLTVPLRRQKLPLAASRSLRWRTEA